MEKAIEKNHSTLKKKNQPWAILLMITSTEKNIDLTDEENVRNSA